MNKKVFAEECIMRKGKLVRAGSKMLDGFIAAFDAEVVSRFESAGMEICGTADMNEFGITAFSAENGGICDAVSCIADGEADAVLCNDFSGVIRQNAPKKGVSYIHPTYGTVSRYGLVPSASSMDCVGVACKDIESGFEILSAIAGKDEKDGAMYPEKSYEFNSKKVNIKNIRIGIPQISDESVREFAKSFETVSFELKYTDVYGLVFQILSAAEICNNINRYDGIKFGFRAENYRGLNELYFNSRTEGFGLPAKFAAILGSLVLSEKYYVKYYEKAMKIRRLIAESLDFGEYSAIALPCGAVELAPLAGLPSVSFPYGEGGVSLVAAPKNENTLYGAYMAVKEAAE